MRDFWAKEDFIELHSPKLTGAATESGAELFKLEYFDRMATLAQSPQFYKQMAMAAGFGKVFEVGPVFRANPSFTSRHDTEFTSVDIGDLVDRLARGRDVLRGALARAHARGRQGRARRADRARRSTRRSSCPSCRSRGSRSRTPRQLLRDAGHDAPPARATISTRRASARSRRSSRSATATSSRSSPTTRRRCGPSTTCATRTGRP